MAITETPLTDPVPQATGNTLPGAAAEAAGALTNMVPPPPTAEQALLQANYGDQGAQSYQALRDAGNVAQTPAPSSNVGNTVGRVVGDTAGGLLGVLAAGLTGNPMLPQQMEQQKVAADAAKAKARTDQVLQGADFLTKLRTNNVPLPIRVQLIGQYAASQGRQLSPAEAEYLAYITNDQNSMEHLTERMKLGDPEAINQFSMLFSGDPTKLMTAASDIKKSNAEADRALAEAKLSGAKVPFAEETAAAQADKIAAEAEKARAEAAAKAGGGGETPKTPFQTAYGAAIEQLKREGVIPADATNYDKWKPELADRAGVIQQGMKAPPMTIQRAREQVASAQNVAKDLLMKLDDPKFAEAKKRLGPALSATIGGATIGVPEFNVAWSNYRHYGGKGNTPAENALMEAIGYFQGTGFQGFLGGIRNKVIVDDIRVHIPQPWDDEKTIRGKIQYLDDRYKDVLSEFAKGGQPFSTLSRDAQQGIEGAQTGEGTVAPTGAPAAPSGPVDVDTWLKNNP